MKLKRLMIPILLMFSLAGCVQSGDFCFAYTPVPPIDAEIASELVSANRSSASAIVANETYYARHCVG